MYEEVMKAEVKWIKSNEREQQHVRNHGCIEMFAPRLFRASPAFESIILKDITVDLN